MDRFDNELTISSVVGIKKSSDFRTPRVDNSELKRVELHCHTKMSDMDGVSEVEDIIKRAKSWGHKAIAVTDHGVVQAYPAASHSLEKGDNFKVIYGVEGYLVDDLKDIVTDAADKAWTTPMWFSTLRPPAFPRKMTGSLKSEPCGWNRVRSRTNSVYS